VSDIFPLPLRRLGRTERLVTALGLGGAALNTGSYGRTYTEAESIACVRRALELGVTYFDTSPLYGDSERRIGLALDGWPRDRVFLATKTGTGTRPKDYSGEGTRRSVEESLRRLRTERLDLVQIHDPDDLSPALAPGGALDVLQRFKEEGVIGAIGLGVRSHEFLRTAIHHGAFDTILTYADFNLVRQTARETLFADARAHGVGIILGSPLLFGYLTNRPWEQVVAEHKDIEVSEDARRAREMREWAEARGVDIVALALQYCLRDQRVGVVLVGAGTPEEIEENVRAVTSDVPETVWAALKKEMGVE
jgi:aryl-alcohol dehydrogenase-like predicted oxidoreductase